MQLVLARFVAVLNHDFCPDANRFVYWLKKPLSILVIAAVVALACALLLNPQAFAAVGGLAVVIVLGLVWPTVALRGLSSRLEWERARCREGETVRARLVIKNRCPWPIWGLTLEGGFRSDAPAAALARVAGFSEVEFRWEFTPNQRGVYPLATPQLSTGFPFGLWHAKRPCSEIGSLIVWPSRMSLDMLPDLTDTRVSEDRTTDRRAGDCGDLIGTRPFRQGDSLRRIHWAQSARHQRFIVTERQAGIEGSVSVRVDLDAEHHVGEGREGSFEWTLRIAASICECLADGHLHVDCWLGSECFSLQTARGAQRLLDRMAALPDGGVRMTETAVTDRPAHKLSGQKSAARGTFEILCTTDVGWSTAAHHSRFHRDRRAVVLKSGQVVEHTVALSDLDAHADHDCVLSNRRAGSNIETHAASRERPWLMVETDQDVPSGFRQQWRRACRVA